MKTELVHLDGLPERPRLSAVLRRLGIATMTIALAGMLAACAASRVPTPTQGAAPLVISQATYAALNEYIDAIYPYRRGVFAVSADGNNSFYFYCPDASCETNLFGTHAVAQCESLSGQDCLMLYVGLEPRSAYTVASAKGVAGHHGKRRARPLDEINQIN
ncbi:MAG: hypothetical protein JNL25_17285 [Rhodospirillaceae bacterium]|nr:hypothetical protein [Rhodospirillaceae bacterium]